MRNKQCRSILEKDCPALHSYAQRATLHVRSALYAHGGSAQKFVPVVGLIGQGCLLGSVFFHTLRGKMSFNKTPHLTAEMYLVLFLSVWSTQPLVLFVKQKHQDRTR